MSITLREAEMSLELKEGEVALRVQPTTLRTKAEAQMFAALVEKMAESLSDTKPRRRRPVKATRQTTSPRRKKAAGDDATTSAQAPLV